MQTYRDFLPGAPEELGAFVGLKTVPPVDPFPAEHQGKRACAIIACYNGPIERGQAIMAKLLDELPPPLFNWMGEMSYPALQSMFDPFLPKGLQWYWRGDFVKELTDEAIDAHIAQAQKLPSPLSLMHLYPIDGAVRRIGKTTPPGIRAMRLGRWSSPASIPIRKRRAKSPAGPRAIGRPHPYSADGGYVNFMMDDGDDNRLKATYGDNYDRLVALKDKYDPTNFFRVNQNIRPLNS